MFSFFLEQMNMKMETFYYIGVCSLPITAVEMSGEWSGKRSIDITYTYKP